MHWLLSALAILGAHLTYGPWLQAPGFADITRPVSGEAVRGIVTLEGTANHPAFDHFDLAFGYDPDPTDTWFPIVDSDRSKVVEGRLAVWDTSAVADGVYRLRLRVWPAEGQPLVALVGGVRVRNQSAIETPTPGPTAQAAQSTAVLESPTPSPTPTEVVVAAPEPGGRVRSAFLAGGVLGILALGGTAAYAGWRAVRRAGWGSPRAVHRADRRRRARERL
jgi:hypothetical protein